MGVGEGFLDWFRVMFLPETLNYSPFDRQVAMLRNKVGVAKDTRSYIISISFTACSADEAARVVNTVAVEYLRDKWIQRKRGAVSAAEAELSRLLAVNGDKHPKVLQAADALDAARADLKAFMGSDEGGQARSSGARTTDVRLAVPNRTPTSPKGKVVLGLACMLGLLAGVGFAIWRDWRRHEPFDNHADNSALDRSSSGGDPTALRASASARDDRQDG